MAILKEGQQIPTREEQQAEIDRKKEELNKDREKHATRRSSKKEEPQTEE